MADEEREVTQAGAPEEEYEVQSTPGPVARGLSNALMQGAFEKFGHAFTDTGHVRQDMMSEGQRMAPWREQGAKVASALEMRWHTMEYENFQAGTVEPYMDQKRMMLNNYKQLHEDLDNGVFQGPNGPQQVDLSNPGGREQMIRMRGRLEKDFYGRNSDMDIELFNQAYKFAKNPLISKRIEMIAKATSDQLMRIGNPQDTMESEGKMSEIALRERTADANDQRVAAEAARAQQQQRPKDLREALQHPEIGPAGAMQWMMGTPEGEALQYSSQGADSYRKAQSAMRQQILKDNPSLEQEPEKVEQMLLGLEGRIRNMAAGDLLKRLDPLAYEAAKEATPHFFDFNKKTGSAEGEGILGPDDPRGITGKARMSTKNKKALYGKWKDQWDAELDKWASDPSHPADAEAAMEYMEQWVKTAITDGGEGIPSEITIAYNQGTKELRAELISELIARGGQTVHKQSHIAEGSPMAALFSGKGKIRAGKMGAPARAARERKRKGLLEED